MSYVTGAAGRTTIVTAIAATQVTIDLGSTPVQRGGFNITDANISATSKILLATAPAVYTGKGTLTDEAELQGPIEYLAFPGSGGATVTWESRLWQYGKIKINYVVL